jgi:hypothetical protein
MHLCTLMKVNRKRHCPKSFDNMRAALGSWARQSSVVVGSSELYRALSGTVSSGSAAIGAPSEVQMKGTIHLQRTGFRKWVEI